MATTPDTSTATATGTRRSGLFVAVVLAAQLMITMDSTIMTVALPTLRAALRFSPAGLSWVMNGYQLAFGGLLLFGGRAGDRFGRRRVFLAGTGLFTAASALGAAAPGPAALLAARAAQGVGAALAAPSALALIMSAFTGAARARVIALFSAVGGTGMSAGMLLGGALAGVSWRWIFLVNVPVGLVVLALAPRVAAETPRHAARLDTAGAVTGTAGLTALVYGLIRTSVAGWSEPYALGAFGVAAALLVAFLVLESRRRAPLLPLRLFADRTRSAGFAVLLLVPAAMFGVFFYLSQYLGDRLGYGPLRTGAAFLPLTVAVIAGARIAPRLLHRIGPRVLIGAGTALVAVGALWLSRLGPGDGYLVSLLGPLTVLGAGVGLTFAPLSATVLATVPIADAGAAAGAAQTMQQVGGAVGLAVLVTVRGAVPHLGDIYLVTAGLALAAAALTVLLIRRPA